MEKSSAHSGTPRDAKINLRASSNQKALIDQATEVLGKNRSDFMLDASCRKEESGLVDRVFFRLDPDRFQAFTKLLDASPVTNSMLQSLLRKKAPREREMFQS